MGFFTKKKRVLVVDDEPDIAASIQARLALEKFDVAIEPDGERGVNKVRSWKPDLVIMDVMMPVMDGLDACRCLKADADVKHIPILVLTALPHVRDAEDALAAGADDFLNKPFTNERLLQKVRKFL